MEDFQERVVEEQIELDKKIRRLSYFIASSKFKSVNPDEQERMKEQLGFMNQYSAVLGKRIEAF